MSAASPFDPLRAPPGDGEVLIQPPLSAWRGMIARNRELKTQYRFQVCGEPVSHVHAADGAPLILIGHQPEFFHPGVWIKNVVGARFAESIGGEAWFVIVENDAPDHTTVRWPQLTGDTLHIVQMEFPWAGAGVTFEQRSEERRVGVEC